MKPRILVDVDGVLADFLTPSLSILNRLSDKQFGWSDLGEWDVFSLYDPKYEQAFYAECSKPGFCSSLPVFTGAKEGFRDLQGLGNVFIVTSPLQHNATWVFERQQWLFKHFAIGHQYIVHTSAKYVCTGDIIIDDKPDNVEMWLKHHPQGLGILYDQPYNRKYRLTDRLVRAEGWPEVINLVRERCM